MPATAAPVHVPAVDQPGHPLFALATFELPTTAASSRGPSPSSTSSTPYPRSGPTCRPGSMPCWPSRTIAPRSPVPDDRRDLIGQLTAAALDRYASQLARCLKALETGAPIRVQVQHELATVRAEQEARASSSPGDPPRRYERERADGRRAGPHPPRAGRQPRPGPAGLTGTCADPGASGRHRC